MTENQPLPKRKYVDETTPYMKSFNRPNPG